MYYRKLTKIIYSKYIVMNSLETLKEKLKQKPSVQPNQGVKVKLAQQEQKPVAAEEKRGPIITAEKDNGSRAKDILEKIKTKKLSVVVKKFPEEPKEIAEPKAPIVQEVELKKVKKLKDKNILQQEKEPQPQVDLPEGGPRMDEPKAVEEAPELKAEEMVLDLDAVKQPKKRKVEKVRKDVIPLGTMIQIGDTPLSRRLPPPSVFDVKVSSYYMNNREIFLNFINGLFEPYKNDLLDESKGISCEEIGKDTGEVGLLTHQKIIRDYMNLYTPYRGLLLYHGLGAGKTCGSIAIAEAMKSAKEVIVMTPASLKRNYLEEIKKCGDLLYRKNQFWEWISIDDNPTFIEPLSKALGLDSTYITRNRGVWLVNVTKPSNYNELSGNDKKVLNNQLDAMIQKKYKFINYNGLRRDRFRDMTDNFTNNIFDNKVVIIDEAHNLISRIVNKINKIRKFAEKKRGPGTLLPQSLSLVLYEFLLRAENCRVVLLTGTPIINYPNEIGILFNILRGYIKTWKFTLESKSGKLSKETLLNIFSNEKLLDYIDYIPSSKSLVITRNPYGFENKITSSGYKGVTNEKKAKKNDAGEIERDSNGAVIYEERGTMSDSDFVKRITKVLKKNDITAVAQGTTFTVNTALPDTLEEFKNTFINPQTTAVTNTDKFKRRIVGLTSYFRSAQEELMPAYDKNFDKHIVYIPMSDYQFKIYEDYRHDERKTEKPNKKSGAEQNMDGLFKEPSSTYRIFSRLACNFVMPQPPGRPTPLEYHAVQRVEASVEQQKPLLEAEEMAKEVIKEAEAKPNPRQNNLDKERDKEREKEREKVKKELLKAEKEKEKQAKERQKAEEKEAKERQKAEEKEAKRKQKEEEKAEKERQKAEEKERKKAEKLKKGGSNDEDEDENEDDESESEDEDEDEDEDDYEDEETMVGGENEDDSVNPAEKFVDDRDDEDKGAIILEDYKDEDAILREADELEGDELLETMGSVEYKEAIRQAVRYLQLHSQEFLTPEGLKIYSPKFLAMLENIEEPDHQGLHLIYSQFRSMEGIGIFSLVLEANGFAKFKIKRTGTDGWELNMSEEDMGKPCYALYTGTEDAEEREIIRNIYNGTWNYIPNNIATQLRTKSSNNNLGEIIKVLMITSAGSEGINLRNTRYVHIMEPYWHPVRVEQVIGRARRICSHQSLPKALQTVEVFVYIMTFTKEQLDGEYAIELKLKDKSKIAPFLPQTSDQKLLEISTIKEQLTVQLLTAVKETSIDCATHTKSNAKEGLVCLSFGQPTAADFAYNPTITEDQNDTIATINKVTIDWEARELTLPTGKKYILRMDTQQVYDYDSVQQARQIPGIRPILLGKLVQLRSGEMEIVREQV